MLVGILLKQSAICLHGFRKLGFDKKQVSLPLDLPLHAVLGDVNSGVEAGGG